MAGWWVARFGLAAFVAVAGCARQDAPAAPPPVEHVLLITIDTLRADRVGAYGYARAQTPALDSLAKNGVRFDRAYAVAPITQTSHASLLTGLYPAGHGARHNGIRVNDAAPLLAERFKAAGFATGAFVAAFPLDRRFGLARGFDVYGDTMPNGPDGKPLNERPGRVVVDEAIAWLGNQWNSGNPRNRVFLWVHLFEPHAPYAGGYDSEIAEADRQVARLLAALGGRRAKTLVVATADHGEAFGEHGEIGHSIFVYDTTLRVPLIISGPSIPAGGTVTADVSLVDLAPTLAPLAGLGAVRDVDGRDLANVLAGHAPPDRAIYAESFAPLLDFGWSPLRSVRLGNWKYIEAPSPELYDVRRDPGETANRQSGEYATAQRLLERMRVGGAGIERGTRPADPDGRLAALGYISGSFGSAYNQSGRHRADPKDKIKVAAAIARITSGEATGADLERELRAVLAEDPANPQMNLRLGYVLASSNRCTEARARFDAAIRGRVPTADAHLGLASCQAAAREFARAIATLQEALLVDPANPVVRANLGLMLSQSGRHAEALAPLRDAVRASPDLHQARFGLALALAETGRRDEARAEAAELLRRLPDDAPQRAEVQRLLQALSSRE